VSQLLDLVRNLILAEGPDLPSECDWQSQVDYDARCEQYVDDTLNAMTNAELLRRISIAIDACVL